MGKKRQSKKSSHMGFPMNLPRRLPGRVVAFIPVFAREVFFETYRRLSALPFFGDVRFLICDNGNAAPLAKRLAALESPACHIIRLERNVGGAGAFAACWEAAKEWFVDCPYVWMLDDDAEPSDNTLPVLIEETRRLLKQGVSVGGVCTANVGKATGVIMECGSKENWRLRPFVQYCRGERVPRRGKTFEVGYGPAASHLTRREVLERVGFFNAELFLHFDDIDWCLRVRKAGYRLFATTKAYFIHPEPHFTARWVAYYDVRNYLWCAWRYGKLGVLLSLKAQLPALLRIRLHLPPAFVCYEWLAVKDFFHGRRRMRDELPMNRAPEPFRCEMVPFATLYKVVIARDEIMVETVARALGSTRENLNVVVYRTKRAKYLSLALALVKQLVFQLLYRKNTIVFMDERCLVYWMMPFFARYKVFTSLYAGLYWYREIADVHTGGGHGSLRFSAVFCVLVAADSFCCFSHSGRGSRFGVAGSFLSLPRAA